MKQRFIALIIPYAMCPFIALGCSPMSSCSSNSHSPDQAEDGIRGGEEILASEGNDREVHECARVEALVDLYDPLTRTNCTWILDDEDAIEGMIADLHADFRMESRGKITRARPAATVSDAMVVVFCDRAAPEIYSINCLTEGGLVEDYPDIREFFDPYVRNAPLWTVEEFNFRPREPFEQPEVIVFKY